MTDQPSETFTDVPKPWVWFFWVAAVFNAVIGLSGMLSATSNLDGRVIGLLMLGFGFIYALVAREPRRFAPALWAGLLCKIGIVALVAPLAFGADSDPILSGVITADAIFASGFLAFLLFVVDRGEN